MRITEVDKGLTQSELDQLEVFADRLFAKVGIDVEFTRHFLDRVNDERNVKQITASELTRLFKQEYKRWGKPIAQMGPDSEAVLKDLATDVNIPFALRWDSTNNELDLIAKTVMRKKNFKTSNKEFEVQSVDYSLDNIQHKKVFESIRQLNEAGPALLAVPAGIGAFELLAYSMAFATGAALVLDIQQNPEKYNWAMKQMAKAYTASVELMFGKDEPGTLPSQKELDAALVDATTTAIETLPTQVQTELSDSTKKIIADVEERAAIMDKQRADGVSAEVIAKTFIDSLTNKSEDEIAATTTAVVTGTDDEISSAISDELSRLEGTVDLPLQRAAAAIKAQKIAQIEIDKMDAQTATADAKLIALSKAVAATNAQAANDAYQNNKIDDIATKSDADAKANRQTKASDARLIALANQIAKQNADDRATKLSDKNLIALGTAYAKTQADLKATELSDQKLKELGKTVAAAQAQAANDAYQNSKIDAIANKSDADAKAAKSAAATAANTAYQNNKIDAIANKSDADAKANRQTKDSDNALIKTAQAYAAAQAQAANDAYQNDKIDNIANKSDSAAAADALSKAIADAQAANDAYQNSKIDDTATKSDAEAKARALEIALANAKIVDDGNDINLNIPTNVIGKNDVTIAPANTNVIGKNDTSHATDRDFIIPAVGVKTGDIAKVNTNTRTNTNNRSGKKKTKKFDWGLGDGDYWDTNLYKWTQKYGTFENQNLVKKYFMINEGGAMPGVGAIHIDEITPTLQALEKSIGVDLMNNTLGSVGKRQFSGDIDVALQIQPEELPAFIEELKKNPLVLDIAKSSVIMTKVKIMDFDESKSDGRPRTGFVQVDFMPGDPGWMKTYYHSPSETESKYKGVYRNIMIATLAAVHNRDQSDAKLDDGRAMEERRFMWSPTEGLLRVQRTPVPKKSGDGYTKKNKNETIDGPWKQPDEIAAQLGLDSGKDLNSFESLLAAVKKNWTKEKLQYVIDGFKQNNVVQDIGVPEELDDVN